MQQLLLVGPHPGHLSIEKVSAPSQTRRVRIQVKIRSRCPESNPSQSPSTKTGPVSLPVAKAPEEREGLTQGTSAPSDATVKCASEGVREGPAARAKPGDQGSPAKAELGEHPWYKSSPLPSGISSLAPETERPSQPRYRWSCRDTSQSVRARDLTSSRLSQSRGCDKVRGATGLTAWLPTPRRRESTSRPDSGEV